MWALVILSVGIAVVIGGILGLRLNAFVALVVAGLVVAILTPSHLLERTVLVETGVRVSGESAIVDQRTIVIPDAGMTSGVLVRDHGRDQPFSEIGVAKAVDGAAGHFKLSDDASEMLPGDRLILIGAADYAAARKLSGTSFITRLTETLGEYCGKLAILIVAASIIGRCLLASGAADRIVGATLSVMGERKAPAAFLTSGFLLSIPVFFDTVFYLMIPLGKALRLRTGHNYLLYVLSIVAGGTMAHSLVPPTPGPLFIAEEFQVPISSMIVGGTLVGLFSSCFGMIYAYWINSRCVLPLRDFDDSPGVSATQDSGQVQPSLWLSVLPILLPVVLITGGSLLKNHPTTGLTLADVEIPDSLWRVMKNVTEKNVALIISAALAVLTYVVAKRPSKTQVSEQLHQAITSAGTIILVTAAGGAFGRMMRQTAVSELLQELPGTSPVMIVIAAFFVTTAVRTAQGSATVAMFTSAGIFGGIVAGGAAGVDPLYVALAVGCGSKPFSWMNDSGFLVITRMSGMTESEGLRYVTPMTALAAFAGLGAVVTGVLLFP